MKKKVYYYFKKLLYRFGIFLQFFPDAESLFKYLANKPLVIKEYELKRITKTVAIAKDHSFYNRILKHFIHNWNIKIEEASFFGRGIGESSLNSFRRIRSNNKTLYEKVYFNSFNELETIIWFQDNIYPLIKQGGIKTAKVNSSYTGDIITVVYSEYLNLTAVRTEKIRKNLIKVTQLLYELDFGKTLLERAPIHIRDFQYHFLYQRNFVKAKAELQMQNIDADVVEKKIYTSKSVLTHGDLNEGNLFSNFTLIDWDSFGIFPIGLEIAYLYYRMYLRYEKDNNPKQWLKDHYQTEIYTEDWNQLAMNFFYFLYIFSCEFLERNHSKDIRYQLLKEIKKNR